MKKIKKAPAEDNSFSGDKWHHGKLPHKRMKHRSLLKPSLFRDYFKFDLQRIRNKIDKETNLLKNEANQRKCHNYLRSSTRQFCSRILLRLDSIFTIFKHKSNLIQLFVCPRLTSLQATPYTQIDNLRSTKHLNNCLVQVKGLICHYGFLASSI